MVLTAAERVLLHLLPLWNLREATPALTQEGIAEGTGLLRSHVPRAMKGLISAGNVEVRGGRLRGRGRKVRLYFLTESGIRRARDVVAGVEGEAVWFGDRQVTVRDLADELRVTPLEIVVGLDEDRRYHPRGVSLDLPHAELLNRDAELRDLTEWSLGPAPAMIVYGSRGMGKTALARAFVARSRRPIAWVDIGLDDATGIRRQLAESLRRIGGRGSLDGVEEDIRERRPLIVVDGYGEVAEPVVDAMTSLLGIVTGVPGAKLLVLAQASTPSYCRFYGASAVRKGTAGEMHLRGLDLEATRRLLGNPSISEESLRQVYLLTKGCPLYLTLIRDGDGARLREVSRFTAAEVRLLMFSRGAGT